MDGRITIQYLQAYIKAKDHHPERAKDYLLKLVEETGELARAMRKERIPASPDQIKGTIEEEIWDILYYALAVANCYDIDVETWIPIKEKLNQQKYPSEAQFELDR